MADITRFTTIFEANPGSNANKVTKRTRLSYSCNRCRARKLRCDRRQPCGACSKNNGPVTCEFDSPEKAGPGNGVGNRTSSATLTASSQDARVRLQRLEQMVREIADAAGSGTQAAALQRPPADNSSKRAPYNPSTPIYIISPTQTDATYHGATHWGEVLAHIRDIHGVLDTDPIANTGETLSLQQTPQKSSPDFLFGNVAPLTTEDVLDSLPSRQDSDKLVSSYFSAKFTTVPFIHVHQFQKQYEAFWENPSAACFVWISIMFSVLHIASFVVAAKASGELADLEIRRSAFYMGKALECLVAGEYLNNNKYAIHALLIHVHARNMSSKNCDSLLWAVFGFTTRLAQRAGYHRDPTRLSQHFSPFETELRRRTWSYIEILDLMFSCQLGLPPVVYQGGSDTEAPSNYSDDDFNEDTVIMPPPRPPIDPTPILYHQVKARLCHILRRVMQQALRKRLESEEICALTDELHLWYANVPASLQARPIRTTSFNDPSYTIMHRTVLEVVYHKTLCILHRPYFSFGDDKSQYALSRDICQDSALRLLDLHIEFDRESQPGRRIYEDRFMMSSLGLHDFMIAAMLMCLDLNEAKHTRFVRPLRVTWQLQS